jgi:hypothetical protein
VGGPSGGSRPNFTRDVHQFCFAFLASQYFRLPVSGCSLHVLGSNPCRNVVLFAMHLRLNAVSDEVNQDTFPLTGHNREQSTEIAHKLANNRQL